MTTGENSYCFEELLNHAKDEGMEVFLDIIKKGNVRIELSVNEHQGCSVIFTVTDDQDRRILRSSVMDNGKVKIYSSAEEAIQDVLRMLKDHSETAARITY
jgi:hypothetical protein